jgi:predicted DNA-binding transcriptional regulator AlpA
MATKLLTPKEVGERLNISEVTLANSRSTGIGIVMPFIKISNKAIRYRESDVEAYIDSHTYNHNGEIMKVL